VSGGIAHTARSSTGNIRLRRTQMKIKTKVKAGNRCGGPGGIGFDNDI
jgi:hypothetical protein